MNAPAESAPDVLVVGAGPVGLALAAELLRHGVASRVVDLNEGPSIWSKAAVVHARTLEVFASMGVVDEALARGRRVHGVSLFSGTKRIGHVAIDALDSPYPFMLGLSQRDTEQILERHLVALGGHVERRVELASFAREGEAYVATLVHDDGRREEARFDYVCGCDGAHSRVRSVVGLPFEGSTYEEAILQADVRIRWPFEVPGDEALFFESPKGLLGALPLLGEGRYRLLVLVSADEHVDPTIERFQMFLDERGPAGAIVEDPAWMVSFRFHHRMVPRYRVDDVFLCGDAAHVHSPVGGQGMNLGIQDAFNLAWKLALVIKGHAPASLLESYHAERFPIAAATLAATDAATRVATRVLGLKSPIGQRIRDEIFSLASRLPVFEGRVASMLGGVAVDYQGSPIVAEDVTPLREAATARGLADWISFERGPRPGERVGDIDLDVPFDGKDRLFTLLAGTAHTLLLFAGNTETTAGYRGLLRVAEGVAARYGDLVRVLVVAPPGHAPDDFGFRSVVPDVGGALHRRFGARDECLYLVRPDGYVGYRSQPADGEKLMAYLARVLT